MSIRFSYYNSDLGIRQTTPTGHLTIEECTKIIRSVDLKLKTDLLRRIQEPKKKKDLKESLPYVTFSGTFSSRANDKLMERSNYFCIDLDHVGGLKEINDIEKTVSNNYPPALSFISPSGEGIKIVFKINPDAGSHLDFFNAIQSFIKKKTGKDIDEQCKDISRACFLCHDPGIVTETPAILGQEFLEEYLPKTEALKGSISVDKMPNLDFAKLGDELASYNSAKQHTDDKLTFSPGHRNHYIVALTDTCNRFGVSEQFLNSQMQEFVQDDFTLQEIQAVIKSRYSHQEWHGIAKKQELQLDDCPYIRVGTDYYKIIKKSNRWGIIQMDYKRWNRETLSGDFGRKYLKAIPKFDDFCMVPDNINYQQIINNQVNLYNQPCHIPTPGEWPWTKILLEQIFGEQYELGIRYMQILYCYPQWATVILVLVSSKQKTGKTTFVNWISMIFGNNSAVISSMDFQSAFNGHFAKKNIVMIEETLFDKKLTIEKLKALATQKQLSVNQKYIDQFNLEFFGKIILTSNYEDRFAQISNEETRFFVRKLGTPRLLNINIEDDLLKEIPAFIYYLKTLPPLERKDRSGFTTEELKNDSLVAVKKESQHETSKELRILLTDFFDNHENIVEFYASAIDIKNRFFPNEYRTGASWLLRVLKEDFGIQPSVKTERYTPFGEEMAISKTGRPYRFCRDSFQSETE
jgi:hypothetical protein